MHNFPGTWRAPPELNLRVRAGTKVWSGCRGVLSAPSRAGDNVLRREVAAPGHANPQPPQVTGAAEIHPAKGTNRGEAGHRWKAGLPKYCPFTRIVCA